MQPYGFTKKQQGAAVWESACDWPQRSTRTRTCTRAMRSRSFKRAERQRMARDVDMRTELALLDSEPWPGASEDDCCRFGGCWACRQEWRRDWIRARIALGKSGMLHREPLRVKLSEAA